MLARDDSILNNCRKACSGKNTTQIRLVAYFTLYRPVPAEIREIRSPSNSECVSPPQRPNPKPDPADRGFLNRGEPALKEMPHPLMPAIDGLGVRAIELPHDP